MSGSKRPPNLKGIASTLVKAFKDVGGIALVLVVSLLIGSVIILLARVNPIIAYEALFVGAFGNMFSISETFVLATPLIIAGLSVAFAYKSRLFNIGAEGQFYLGAIFGTLVALYLPGIPFPVSLLLLVIAAFLGGAVWGGVAGYLKARFRVSEIISTILLNYVAIYLTSYLVSFPLREPGYYPQSPLFSSAYILPLIIPRTRLHVGLLLGLLIALLYWIVIEKTPLGYKIKLIGSNPTFARYGGINVNLVTILTMAISGGISGIAGMAEVSGIYQRLVDFISPGYGFTAIIVALLGKANPVGVVIAAVFIAALNTGAYMMQRTVGLPSNVVLVIQALAILSILFWNGMPVARDYLRRKR